MIPIYHLFIDRDSEFSKSLPIKRKRKMEKKKGGKKGKKVILIHAWSRLPSLASLEPPRSCSCRRNGVICPLPRSGPLIRRGRSLPVLPCMSSWGSVHRSHRRSPGLFSPSARLAIYCLFFLSLSHTVAQFLLVVCRLWVWVRLIFILILEDT